MNPDDLRAPTGDVRRPAAHLAVGATADVVEGPLPQGPPALPSTFLETSPGTDRQERPNRTTSGTKRTRVRPAG